MTLARSYLYVPATRPDRFAKALASGADAVILDLEDSVPPDAKPAARAAAAAFLADAGGEAELWVRVNGGDLLADDVAAVGPAPALTGLCLAKAERAADLRALDGLLERPLPVEPLVESAAALLRAEELARAPRVRRLQLGEVDLAADLGVRPGADGNELLWARSSLVTASAAAGIHAPVGPVSTEFRNLDAFRASTKAVRALSKIMKTADGAFHQCYNGQAIVDSTRQVIVAAELSDQAPDARLLEGSLDQLDENLETIDAQLPDGAVLLGDAGYFSEHNIVITAEHGLDAHLATGRFKHSEPPAPAPRGPIPKDATPKQRMARKLKKNAGATIYARRKTIVEPVFGQMDTVQDARQLLLRGRDPARAQWRFHCAIHNLLKLHRNGGLALIATG